MSPKYVVERLAAVTIFVAESQKEECKARIRGELSRICNLARLTILDLPQAGGLSMYAPVTAEMSPEEAGKWTIDLSQYNYIYKATIHTYLSKDGFQYYGIWNGKDYTIYVPDDDDPIVITPEEIN